MTVANAIRVAGVGKRFRLFASRRDRLMEALHPLRRRYHEPFWALQDIDLEVARGRSVGIVGRNGSGKSTLLQVIAGVTPPTRGSVATSGRIAALLQLGAGFNPEFTGRENVMLNGVLLGIPESDMRRRLPEVEAFAGLGRFFEQPVGTYSSGMFARLGFAAAMSVDADILIVDEAISVGDSAFRFQCFEHIRRFRERGGTLLLVSHEKELLARHCDQGVLLDQGRVIEAGDIASVLNAYDALRFQRAGEPAAPPAAPAANGVEQPAAFNPAHFRSGDRRIVITDCRLLDGDGNGVDRARTGQRLRVRMTCTAQADVERPGYGMGVATPDGVVLYSSGPRWSAGAVPPLRAGQTVVVEFALLLALLPGLFYINLSVFETVNGDPVYMDLRRGILRFLVEGSSQSSGVVELDCTMQLMEPGS